MQLPYGVAVTALQHLLSNFLIFRTCHATLLLPYTGLALSALVPAVTVQQQKKGSSKEATSGFKQRVTPLQHAGIGDATDSAAAPSWLQRERRWQQMAAGEHKRIKDRRTEGQRDRRTEGCCGSARRVKA